MLPGLERLSPGAPDLAEAIGGTGAEEGWHVDAAGDREIGAGAARGRAECHGLTGAHRDAGPALEGLAIQRGRHLGAAHRDHAVVVKAQGGADELAFEPRGARLVAHQAIGNAERPAVHRARDGIAGADHADAARIVLNRGLQAGLQHLHGRDGAQCLCSASSVATQAS